jgi:hypothetical protein
MLNIIFVINGIYDIICGLNLIYNFIPNLAYLHAGVFINIDEITKRFLGYLIFTLGIIRLSLNYEMIFISYMIEAYVFEYENIINKMETLKVRFITITCIILGLLALYIRNTNIK